MYIKIGASGYGKGDFKITDYDNYIEQVKICEEFGIPYGFYYYSTSTNIEEAKMELNCLQERIEKLKEEIDLKNNTFGTVVDIELHSNKDRQYKGNIEQQTEAKASLINGILTQGISDNVLIYGPARVMRPDSDQIVNLRYLQSLLLYPENVGFWLCSPTSEIGNPSKKFEKDVQSIEEQGFPVVAQQVVLDSKIFGTIDINTMNLKHYEKLLNNSKEGAFDKQSSTLEDYGR